jgi:translation initiation factor IF-2
MAKIRIYELARELNMKNKALLDKLAELNISVRSHMSSLEDETVAQIKRALFGKKSAAVEVTRVRPTVIRRRKRDLAKPPEEAPEAYEAPSEEIPAAEAEAPTLEAESAQPAAEEIETVAPPPVSPAPEAPPVETPVEEAPVAETPPEEAPVQPPAEETPAPPVEIAAEAPRGAEAEDQAAAEKSAPAKVEKPVKVKRKKGEAVAKIISLPTREVVRALQAEKEERREAEAPAAKAERRIETPAAVSPEETAAREGRKKKGKKREEEPVAEKKLVRKKEAFRRKEVVEGADLYASGGRGRKGRKAGKTKVAKGQKTQITTPKAIKRRIKVDDAIVLSELAKRMGIKASEIIGKLMGLGVMVTVNQTIDYETAVLVASEFNFEVEKAHSKRRLF